MSVSGSVAITETTSSGTVRGPSRIEDRVVVFFHDPDYQGGPVTVNIGPGETVDLFTQLQRINPVLAPAFGPGPVRAVSR